MAGNLAKLFELAPSHLSLQAQKEATGHENQAYVLRQQLEQAKAAAEQQLVRNCQEAEERLAEVVATASATARDAGRPSYHKDHFEQLHTATHTLSTSAACWDDTVHRVPKRSGN